MIQDLTLILGNQLINPKTVPALFKHPVFMCESDDLCTHYQYHQLKIIFFLTAMRDYHDELVRNKFTCHYYKLSPNKTQIFFEVLKKFVKEHQVETLHFVEIEDHFFTEKLSTFAKDFRITLKSYLSPLFITDRATFSEYLHNTKRPFMKTFYERQRKHLGLLMKDAQKPRGGTWSFDEQNRKPTPKIITFPTVKSVPNPSPHLDSVKTLVRKKFSTHIGSEGVCWFPTSRTDVHNWCKDFIHNRLARFGDYEDAIDTRSDFLFHSGLAPFMNVGLITPNEIITEVMKYEGKVPLNSLEGFIRQIIGWREFVRGIYHHYDGLEQSSNFFNHQRKLTNVWYTGNTDIPPLDDAIKQITRMGYTHHIVRLMVIGNIMLLTQVHPQEVYRWFMEMFIDSSDWVMGPNVFGMSQFSDGGIFATKPYFSGSNYILKMSHYRKTQGENWCGIMDALYWRFIHDQQNFFQKNYRMKFMVSRIKTFPPERIKSIIKISDEYINRITTG